MWSVGNYPGRHQTEDQLDKVVIIAGTLLQAGFKVEGTVHKHEVGDEAGSTGTSAAFSGRS